MQCLLYGVLGNQMVWLWELAANKVECSLICGKTFVNEAILVCDDEGGLLKGASSGVQSRQRDSCVQKLPLATLETLIAISMLATHTWHASVGPRPRVTKSIVWKCRCCGSRAKRFVLINLYIFSWSSSCCPKVRPSLTYNACHYFDTTIACALNSAGSELTFYPNSQPILVDCIGGTSVLLRQ